MKYGAYFLFFDLNSCAVGQKQKDFKHCRRIWETVLHSSLHQASKKKPHYQLDRGVSSYYLGWLMGLEPTTTGITILDFIVFANVDWCGIIYTNQQLTKFILVIKIPAPRGGVFRTAPAAYPNVVVDIRCLDSSRTCRSCLHLRAFPLCSQNTRQSKTRHPTTSSSPAGSV